MRIALVAPPWYAVPPAGYGGIEWVVALLADGLTDRGHDVTLFAPSGSTTRARLVSPLGESPPPDAIGNPWYEASHAVSAYEQGDEFDLLHDHTGPVGVTIGALIDAPIVHTLHGPFTPEALMLYSRIARHLWFVAISESQRSLGPPDLRWAGVVYNGIAMDRYQYREDKDDFLFFLGRADEEKAPDLAIEAARRAGRRLVMCATRKNERERRYGAVPEVIDDGVTGFVVESMDELVRAIGRVGELDPRAARARVEERFSAAAMVTGYERAYERVLAV